VTNPTPLTISIGLPALPPVVMVFALNSYRDCPDTASANCYPAGWLLAKIIKTTIS